MCIVHRIYLQINVTYLTALIIHYFFEKVVQDFSVKFYFLLVVMCFRNVNRCFLCTTLLKHSIILLLLATIIYFCVAEIREWIGWHLVNNFLFFHRSVGYTQDTNILLVLLSAQTVFDARWVNIWYPLCIFLIFTLLYNEQDWWIFWEFFLLWNLW